MRDIDDYSRSALEREGKCITKYSRVEYDGYIQIDYQEKDRLEGAIIGGITGFAAGAGVCAYFVPGAGIVAGTIITATAAGATAGACIGTHYDYTVYFDSQTGEYLGRDRDVARRKVSERRQRREQEEREKAFRRRNSEASENYAKATTAWQEGQRAELSGQSAEAINKFKRAYELYTSASNLAPHNSNYSSQKTICNDKIRTLQLASENYAKASAAWEEGWKAELSGQSDEATNKFKQAYELYTSASNLVPRNSKYTLGKQKCKDKIDGNTLFNEGLELQEKANRLKQEKHYKEALKLYEQAKAKFCEGFQKSQDERFRDCETIVNECIDGIKTSLERQNIINSIASLNFNHQLSNDKEQKTNAQNHLDNQVSIMLDVKKS